MSFSACSFPWPTDGPLDAGQMGLLPHWAGLFVVSNADAMANLLMWVKEESAKCDLKQNIFKKPRSWLLVPLIYGNKGEMTILGGFQDHCRQQLQL